MTLPTGVAAVFPFEPNWSQTVDELYEYKTTIRRSRDRTPQYRGLRSKARCSMRYALLNEGEEAASFTYRMFAVQPYVWMLPQWARRRFLTADTLTGSTTLVLDAEVSYHAAQGDEYILIRDGQEPEVVTLDAVSGDRLTLTLAAPLEADWPARTAVYPAWRAQFDNRVRGDLITDRVLRIPVSFRRLVDTRAPVVSTLTADVTVAGLEVLVRPVNWESPLGLGFDWLAEFIDTGVGPFDYRVDGEVGQRTRRGTYLAESRDEVDWWIAFFARRKGRRIPFLVPTGQGDLLLQDPLGAGDFEVPGTELGRFMPENQVYTHLMVRKKDGSLAFYQVSDISPDFGLGVTSITTVEAWGEAYGPWECVQACFVAYAHLASDSMTVSWITDEAARIELTVSDEVTQ